MPKSLAIPTNKAVYCLLDMSSANSSSLPTALKVDDDQQSMKHCQSDEPSVGETRPRHS